ncbi:hypothetical protein AMTR_s00007p00238990 [Amborella trichopoda]|uniref:Uncharacterized protein n=1 Tax=Amborella trichopoda TaxID=13333 RepID=W1PCJ6_AMBTC|nr:hypothetical protein AMTR_s00007p00238990 [Amborella trichopoda]
MRAGSLPALGRLWPKLAYHAMAKVRAYRACPDPNKIGSSGQSLLVCAWVGDGGGGPNREIREVGPIPPSIQQETELASHWLPIAESALIKVGATRHTYPKLLRFQVA